MPTYADLIVLNKDTLKVEVILSIDNLTLIRSWGFYSNLHVDWGICDKLLRGISTRSRRKARRKMQMYKSCTGKKFKLARTDNCPNYTRLVFKLV